MLQSRETSCCLGNPGQSYRFGSFIRDVRFQIVEAPRIFEPLACYLNVTLFVKAIGIVCNYFRLHLVPCTGCIHAGNTITSLFFLFSINSNTSSAKRTLMNIRPTLLPLLFWGSSASLTILSRKLSIIVSEVNHPCRSQKL